MHDDSSNELILLIATDGSDAAIRAARRATALVPAARVVVASVAEPSPIAAMALARGNGTADLEMAVAVQRDKQLEAESAAARTAAALSTEVPLETRVETGQAGSAICRLAEELPAGVVALGSRGLGTMRRALLGSVSTYVVHNASCPVLVVPS